MAEKSVTPLEAAKDLTLPVVSAICSTNDKDSVNEEDKEKPKPQEDSQSLPSTEAQTGETPRTGIVEQTLGDAKGEKSQSQSRSWTSVDDETSLSKNQLKKKRRFEKAMEVKKRRKLQDKEVKRAKALAAGRDIEEEQRLERERAESGEGHRRREEMWRKRFKTADTSFKISIDCSFESQMSPKEINSLASQIRYCYAANKRSANPVYFSTPGLAGDSENVLEHLDDDKVYIIGGIVDRNRLKRVAIDRAETLGIATARLPIDEHLKLFATKVLTCNHVFEILLKYRENGNDWKKAMLQILPKRKEAEDIGNKDDDVAKEKKATQTKDDDVAEEKKATQTKDDDVVEEKATQTS
eukprot:scaffold104023_cov48-Attheya_sp.AAC.2